jgi:hypothetical protein
VGGFVSWLGALANTASRTDKSWFVVVRVLARLSVGFLATLIYLVAGPPDEPEPATPTVVDMGSRRPTAVAH